MSPSEWVYYPSGLPAPEPPILRYNDITPQIDARIRELAALLGDGTKVCIEGVWRPVRLHV